MKLIGKYWHRFALFIILVFTGFLSFYDIGKEGYANSYYSAAVKSMLSSWHNFFFASFDPGGYVTVDKPALGLWLQALSAKIFGFHGWSLILPEALSAVISVALIYHLVQRLFGKTAGVASALILSLTPILIAVSRTNNLDASLVMTLLFAAWALIAAAERGSLKLLMLSMLLVGLGFNIKMLQAFMVLPAFYLVYMFASSLKTGKKLLHLTGATAVLMAVSLSWATIVDFTPADQRPYIGSSQTNSVIELALGYNGIQRVTGRNNGNGMGAPNVNDGRTDTGRTNNENITKSLNSSDDSQPNMISSGANDGRADAVSSATMQNNGTQSNGSQPNMQPPQNSQNPFDGNGGFSQDDGRGQGGPGGAGGPGGSGETGQKGVFRLFTQQLAGQISWLIPTALFGILVLLLRARNKEDKDRNGVIRNLILWSAWIGPMFVFFSISGFFHRYYLSMLAPGLAALAGIGIVEMWKVYMESGWKWVILPSALVANAALQWLILSRYAQWSKVLTPVVCGISIASALVLVVIRLLNKDYLGKTIKAAIITGFAALLIAPAIWAYTPILYGSQTVLPYAGPDLNRGNGGDGFGQGGGGMAQPEQNTASSKLVDFLIKNKQGEKFIVAVSNANSASSIIIQTGEPVMAVGGFSGSDPILTADKLEAMVKKGEIRYFMLQAMGGGMGSQSEISSWVEQHGTVVSSEQYSGTSGQSGISQGNREFGGGGTLYDLAPEKGTK